MKKRILNNFDIHLLYELIWILNQLMKSMIHYIACRKSKCDHDNEIPIMCNFVVSKLSLVIASTGLDIVDPDRLAHVVLLDLIK